MRIPTQRQKPRRIAEYSFPSPTGGWIANRNLAMGRVKDMPPGAMVLENWFPTARGVQLRRGSVLWSSLGQAGKVDSLFTYVSGNLQKMFAATTATIYDVTLTAPAVALSGKTSGKWVTVQFTTAGGTFLLGVNGKDSPFLYDGSSFSVPSITFPAGSTATLSDLSYAWAYKNRIWFIQKDSLDAWYLPVDQIGGELKKWPMGGVFMRGGSLVWGQTWSSDTGGAGGLSGQCVFCTTEGEVAAYQGLSPDPDQGWSHVGTYRIGRPLGPKALMRAGGDLVIATTSGFISLSAASRSDYAALGRGAVSYPIEDEWSMAVMQRGENDWRCQVWADGQMILVAPPTPINMSPVVFVSNANTGAWAKFTGWDAASLEVFKGQLHFGTNDGRVILANTSGADIGMPYVGRMMPLFEDMGAPGSLKIPRHARAIMRASYEVQEKLTAKFNFDTEFPAPPDQSRFTDISVWDAGIWDESVWNSESGSVVQANWRSVGGSGHDASLALQITSGEVSPSDVELVRLDVTFETAGVVT